MNKHILGIVVPYRDRYDHLEKFKKVVPYYLDSKDIDYRIIIVEQDNAKLFNRGMLLNIGFVYAEAMGCDYVIFHDVDMLPINVDYTYSGTPLHLATDFVENSSMVRTLFDEYFGGVTLFPINEFRRINGYSNKYWGWGYEDNDLLLRCKKSKIKPKIKLDRLKIKNYGNHIFSLRFNGVDAYVKGKNIFNLNKSITIFASFYPDEITCNHEKNQDNYVVFSIPGYDTAISYNSFSRYNFCTFDKNKNAVYLNSNIKTNYRTNICITIDRFNNKISGYQDGKHIGTSPFEHKLMSYKNQEYFYLGAGDPNRVGNEKYFRGYINQFVVFSDVLDEDNIKEISNNMDDVLNKDFGLYTSSHLLQLYYDARFIDNYKLIDLSKKGNDGEIVNCEIVNLEPEKYKIIDIPIRRKSIFSLLSHDENGFVNNDWKSSTIRWNQLRFYNEVSKNDDLLGNDGLSDLKFTEHGIYRKGRITKITVGI